MTKRERCMTLGVDLGGTKVKTALVDTRGRIVAVDTHSTHPERGSDGVIVDVLACVKGCLGKARRDAAALGIGVAGQVDVHGVVRYAPNLRWRDVPLRERLEANLELPVVVVNDVRAATIGEWRFGSGGNVDDLVVLFIGTGIGGGVVSGGRLLQGCSNTGGELGHMTVDVNGRKCHCPNRGCLEAYAGGWAIAERAQEAVRTDPAAGASLSTLAGGVDQITAFNVSQAYRGGDALARRLIAETGQYLAAGIVGLVNAFNPCLIVLGGGVIAGVPELVPQVEAFTRQYALLAAVEPLQFAVAALGSEAPVIGAATAAQHLVDGDP
jgi:glucokinase